MLTENTAEGLIWERKLVGKKEKLNRCIKSDSMPKIVLVKMCRNTALIFTPCNPFSTEK
jgi:hypothetical protein